MLAAVVAPTIYGRSASVLRRVTRPLGVGTQCRKSVGADPPPLLALWNSIKARSSLSPDSAPQWGRLLSSSSGESGDGSEASDKDSKTGEGIEPPESEIVPDDGSKGAGESGSGEGNKGGKKFFDRLNPFKRSVSDKEPEETVASKEPVEVKAAEKENLETSFSDEEPVVSSAIVPNSPRPENFPKVVAIPLTRRPLFPGFYVPFSTKDTKLAAKLMELRMRGTPWVGTFLVKDGSRKSKDPVPFPGVDGDKNEDKLHGEELYKSLHEYGTFAQITNVFRAVDGGEGVSQFLLMGHRRLRLTGVEDDDPLSVTVEHVKDKPYDGSQDVIKATVMEVVTTMKDLIRLNPLYKEHIQLFIQHMGEFNASKLADFGAALTTADEPSLQEVLEELDVTKRLYMTLTLLKKELELSKLQTPGYGGYKLKP